MKAPDQSVIHNIIFTEFYIFLNYEKSWIFITSYKRLITALKNIYRPSPRSKGISSRFTLTNENPPVEEDFIRQVIIFNDALLSQRGRRLS